MMGTVLNLLLGVYGGAPPNPAVWLLKDEFTTDRAAGAVNGTVAEPIGGTRTVIDGSSKISIIADLLTAASGVAIGDGIWYVANTRVVGLIMVAEFTTGGASPVVEIGWGISPTGALHDSVLFNTANVQVRTAGPLVTVGTNSSGVSYKIAVIERASGVMAFIRAGAGNWTMLYTSLTSTAATLYPGLAIRGASSPFTADFIRTPKSAWLPSPLVSDGFASAFGTSDGLGHAEGVAGGLGAGGGGVTLTQQTGTWTVSSGQASASALSGGIAIATAPTSTKDVIADIKVTRSAGAGGTVLRYTDASNYLYTNHDGTNAFLKQVLAGATTTLITAAATYSAGAVLRVDLSGNAGRLYYNNALVGTTASINAGLTATTHGLYVTDVTANLTLDDLVIRAKGTSGEYDSVLNPYIA